MQAEICTAPQRTAGRRGQLAAVSDAAQFSSYRSGRTVPGRSACYTVSAKPAIAPTGGYLLLGLSSVPTESCLVRPLSAVRRKEPALALVAALSSSCQLARAAGGPKKCCTGSMAATDPIPGLGSSLRQHEICTAPPLGAALPGWPVLVMAVALSSNCTRVQTKTVPQP